MKSKEEILRILRRELPFMKNKYKVRGIALFGSYVRGEQSEKSDSDVLVEFEELVGYSNFIELEEYLSMKLEIKVDLVDPDALKSLIKPYIMGEVVYA